MKKIALLLFCSVVFFGCAMNPSKEARIQKLEADLAQTLVKIELLESKVQELEAANLELEIRMKGLEE